MLGALLVAAQAIRAVAVGGKFLYDEGQGVMLTRSEMKKDAQALAAVDWELALAEAREVLANPERYQQAEIEMAQLVINDAQATRELEARLIEESLRKEASSAAKVADRERQRALKAEQARQQESDRAAIERERRRDWAVAVLAAPENNDPLDVLTATEYARQLGLL